MSSNNGNNFLILFLKKLKDSDKIIKQINYKFECNVHIHIYNFTSNWGHVSN